MADADRLYVSADLAAAELGITAVAELSLLPGWIESASREIDRLCDRRFYTPTLPETRRFDVPVDHLLVLDYDLLSITSLVNGDGGAVTSSQYLLLPANSTPKWAIALKPSTGARWIYDAGGESHQAIAVTGYWGYSASAPPPIQDLCLELVKEWRDARALVSGVTAKHDGDVGISYGSTAATSADLRKRIARYRYMPHVY